MKYEIENISENNWESIRECSDNLRAITAAPRKRAIDRISMNFLVEIGNDDDLRGEFFSQKQQGVKS